MGVIRAHHIYFTPFNLKFSDESELLVMSEQTVERKMTIARAMTRISTIDAQLDSIIGRVRVFGAGNNKVICRLSNKKDLKENHAEVEKEMRSLYQQFRDLCEEKLRLKLAIHKANLENTIEVSGRVMTLAEALIMYNNISGKYSNMLSAFSVAVTAAEKDVNSYNSNVLGNITDEKARAILVADIAYFVDAKDVKELEAFTATFKAEVNGLLNEKNATTEIII